MARDGEAGWANGFIVLGPTGLTMTRLGFGTYRVDMQNSEYREALKKALRQSCNLIDTSTNYTDGDSERLVGSVLAELVASGEVRRDEIIVVSKIGYVQGQNLKLAEAKEQSGRPYPELVKYGDGIWHCVHPEFLAERPELYRSLSPPRRVHGERVADHMAAMLTAERRRVRSLEAEVDAAVTAGRAGYGLTIRVRLAVLALMRSTDVIETVTQELALCYVAEQALGLPKSY